MIRSDASADDRTPFITARARRARGQIAVCWQELENGSPRRPRRELLEWQIRKAEKRLAEIGTRLAAIRLEAP
jgi:hypothetical protein